MNWIVKWGVKKYAVKFANEILAAHAANVEKARGIVRKATQKARAVLEYLDKLDAKLMDNQITAEEAEGLIADTTALVDNLTGKAAS